MKTIYKVIQTDGTRGGIGLFKKEWFCVTQKLAEAFKAEKEKSEQVMVGSMPKSSGYLVSPVSVMECEDDFYKKELR